METHTSAEIKQADVIRDVYHFTCGDVNIDCTNLAF